MEAGIPRVPVELAEVAADVGPRGADTIMGLEVDAFVLHATPQALYKHVVAPGPASIHRLLALKCHASTTLREVEKPRNNNYSVKHVPKQLPNETDPVPC